MSICCGYSVYVAHSILYAPRAWEGYQKKKEIHGGQRGRPAMEENGKDCIYVEEAQE